MLRFTDEKSKNIWGFDPRSLPGCVLWYDAADPSTLIKPDGNPVSANGDEVAQWNSKAGGRFMTALTGAVTYGPSYYANYPRYSNAGFNSKPCVSIYDSNYPIPISGASGTVSCAMLESGVTPFRGHCEVFPRDGTHVSFQVFTASNRIQSDYCGLTASLITSYNSSGGPVYNAIPYAGGALDGSSWNGSVYTNFNTTSGLYLGENGKSVPYTTPVMTTLKYKFENSGSQQYTKETTTIWSGGTHTSLPITIYPNGEQMSRIGYPYIGTSFMIGSNDGNYGFPGTSEGLHAEYIAYNEPLTFGQIQQVQGYLARKWGFDQYLPVTHPYYSIPSCNRLFQPLDIPGCILWLDGNDTTTMFQSGGSVITDPSQVTATWEDKSGKGNHFSGEGYGWTGYGMFIPTGSSFSNPSSYITTQGTNVFVVWNKPSSTTSQTVYSFSNTATPSNYVEISTNNFYIQDPTIGFNGFSNGPVTFGSNRPYLYSASTINGYMPVGNNGSTTTGLITLAATINGNNFISNVNLDGIATNSGATTNNWSISDGSDDINILEVLHYDSVLDTSQIDQIQGYLAWKWKLQDTPSHLQDQVYDVEGNYIIYRTSGPYYIYDNNWSTYYSANPHTLALNPPNSSPDFSPKCIDGCMLWLDGADASTISQSSGSFVRVTTPGQTVYQWTDKALGGKVTTGATGITYQTVPPGLSFNGTTGMVLSSATAYSKANPPITTVFAVTKSTYTATYAILGTRWNSGANVLALGISNSTQIVTNISGTTLLTGSNMGTGINLSSYTFDPVSSNGYMYSNGTQSTTSTVTASNVNKALTDFSVGKMWNGSADTNFFKGSIHELIVYNGILTDDQRQKIEGYLAQKWHF
jgi:hypothetical protein